MKKRVIQSEAKGEVEESAQKQRFFTVFRMTNRIILRSTQNELCKMKTFCTAH